MAAPCGASRAPQLLRLLGLVLLCAVLSWVTSLQLLDTVDSASWLGGGPSGAAAALQGAAARPPREDAEHELAQQLQEVETAPPRDAQAQQRQAEETKPPRDAQVKQQAEPQRDEKNGGGEVSIGASSESRSSGAGASVDASGESRGRGVVAGAAGAGSGPASSDSSSARLPSGLPDSVGRVPVSGPVSLSGPVSHLAAEAREYARQTGRLDRVYCMVPTVWTKNRQGLMRAIIRTWGGRCDYVKFMVDRDETGVVPRFIEAEGRRAEIVHIPMVRKPDSICNDGEVCRHIWEKVWRSWVYVFQNDLDKAEWFLKIDDDSFYVPTNMRKYVRDQRWLPDDKHYFGHLVYIDAEPFELISGICTAFSRGSIRALAPRLLAMKHEYGARTNFPKSHGTCVDRDGATEERVTSKCMAEVGIRAEAALEDGRSEAVLPLGLPFTATYKRKPNTTSWYWFKKPKTRGDAWDCCSKSYTWGIHGYKGDGDRVLEFHERMFNWSSARLMQLRDKHPVMSDPWAYPQFSLQLRASIAADPHAYPAATIPA